jgi:hypothetical protein
MARLSLTKRTIKLNRTVAQTLQKAEGDDKSLADCWLRVTNDYLPNQVVCPVVFHNVRIVHQQRFSSFDLTHGMRNEVEGEERGPATLQN